MVEHDGHVGKLLKALDDLGIADNNIVLYTTDNGPHMNSWPDGAMTPFRGVIQRRGEYALLRIVVEPDDKNP
jgi:arylsulfatase A-like enzyme